MDQNQVILAEKHLCTNCHEIPGDGKFPIIERIEQDRNIKRIIKEADKWIKSLNDIYHLD